MAKQLKNIRHQGRTLSRDQPRSSGRPAEAWSGWFWPTWVRFETRRPMISRILDSADEIIVPRQRFDADEAVARKPVRNFRLRILDAAAGSPTSCKSDGRRGPAPFAATVQIPFDVGSASRGRAVTFVQRRQSKAFAVFDRLARSNNDTGDGAVRLQIGSQCGRERGAAIVRAHYAGASPITRSFSRRSPGLCSAPATRRKTCGASTG